MRGGPDRLSAADARDLAWLLELEWSGRVFRYAMQTETVTISGEAHRYQAGLSWGGSIEDTASLRQSLPTISASFAIDGEVAPDVPGLIANGIWPEQAEVRVYQWSRSTGVRVLRLIGAISSWAYGEAGEAFEFGVDLGVGDDHGRIVEPSQRVGPDTFTNASSGRQDIMGMPYPVIIGTPGKLDAAQVGPFTTITVVPGSEAMLVDSTTLLVAGGAVLGGTVRLEDSDGNTDTAATIDTDDVDLLLQPVSVILAGDTTLTLSSDKEYRVAWTGAGGIIGADGALMRGAGDVLLWAAARSSWEWDLPWIESIAPTLNRYQLDGVIQGLPDEPIRPGPWILEVLLPLLPVAMRRSPRGWRPIVLPYWSTPSDASFALVEGQNAERIARWREDEGAGGPANEIVFSYAYDVGTDKPARQIIAAGNPDRPGAEPAAEGHPLLARSQARYRRLDAQGRLIDDGVRRVERESRMVYSERTARLIVEGWIALQAQPPIRAVYRVPSDIIEPQDPGAVCLLSDERMQTTDRIAFVAEIARGPGQYSEVELLLWERIGQ